MNVTLFHKRLSLEKRENQSAVSVLAKIEESYEIVKIIGKHESHEKSCKLSAKQNCDESCKIVKKYETSSESVKSDDPSGDDSANVTAEGRFGKHSLFFRRSISMGQSMRLQKSE
jgi:hypothetical protein